MNTDAIVIDATDRPVIRVRVKQPVGGTKLKYFTSISSAARYVAWQRVYTAYRVFDSEYTVNGARCECERNAWSGVVTDPTGCPLHDHGDGFYVNEMRRLKAEILADWETRP